MNYRLIHFDYSIYRLLRCLLLLFLLGWAAGVASAGQDVTVIPRVETPPVADGQIGEKEWADATVVTLQPLKPGQTLQARTTVRMMYDAEHLYLAFDCEEPTPEKLRVTWPFLEEQDNPVWQDDSVEVFLDPHARQDPKAFRPVIHLAVNTRGVWYDGWDENVRFDADLTTAAHVGEKAWTLELVIPFADLGFVPKGGEHWLMNLGRERHAGNEYSTWGAGEGNLGNPTRYRPVVFAGGGAVELLSLDAEQKHRVRVRITNPAEKTETYTAALKVTRGNSTFTDETRKIELQPGQAKVIEIPYRVLRGRQQISLAVTGPDGTLYENAFRYEKGSPERNIVYRVDDPLYAPVLSNAPAGLVREGTLYWFHSGTASTMQRMSIQYAQRYSLEEVYRECAEQHLTPYANSGVLTRPLFGLLDAAERLGFKVALYVRPFNPKPIPGHKLPPETFLLDPAYRKAYLENARSMIRKYGHLMFAVSFGDEVWGHVEYPAIQLLANHAEDYPYIRLIDEKVRTIYGGGKWGIPHGPNDGNPYRWMAFRRWLNDELLDLMGDLYLLTKRENPDIQVVSDDMHGFSHPYAFSRFKGRCDIVAQQFYPRRVPEMAWFGYQSRILHDLTGIKEIHPVPHIENYAESYTPSEALALLNQAVRNGTTGFQLYSSDTRGRRRKTGGMEHEAWIAPDRWQVTLAVLKLLQAGNVPQQPEPDCAILYGTDTLASIRDLREEFRAIQFTFLGPVTRAALRFIDDYQLVDGMDLSRFKAIYLPDAKYLRREAVAALKRYVEAGGGLVATDPRAMTQTPLAESLEESKRELFGVTVGARAKRKHLTWNGIPLPMVSGAYELTLDEGTAVVASFDDGSPAITKKSHGGGACYLLATRPLTRRGLQSNAWKRFFRAFHESLGCRTGENIWRFAFPESIIQPLPEPTGQCLTGNYFQARSGKIRFTRNVRTGGSYSYSRPVPTGEPGGRQSVSFSKGDLTDRRSAPTAGDIARADKSIADWIVAFEKPEPVDIDFDFRRAYPVNRVVLFYNGQLPEVTVLTSQDGQNWTPAASRPAEAKPTGRWDVLPVEVTFPPVEARYVRLKLGPRGGDQHLWLIETEIWGPTNGPAEPEKDTP